MRSLPSLKLSLAALLASTSLAVGCTSSSDTPSPLPSDAATDAGSDTTTTADTSSSDAAKEADVATTDTAATDTTASDTTVGDTTTADTSATDVADTGTTTDASGADADAVVPVTNACLDTADETALAGASFSNDVGTCTLSNVASGAGAIATCLETKDGLSAPCAGCFGTYGLCGATNCFSVCTTDAGASAPACQACIATHCGAALATCSGITPSTDAGTSGDATSDAATSCSAADGGASACQSCCAATHSTGFATFNGLVAGTCACAPTSPCYATCGGDDAGAPAICGGGEAGAPSSACQACIGTEESMGAASSCVLSAATSASCTGDCAAFVACGEGC